MSYAEIFRDAYPKALDFVKAEYDANAGEIDAAALAAGYRLAGVRLGFAVFTSKPIIQEKGLDA